jgi:argininosuccinate lyase
MLVEQKLVPKGLAKDIADGISTIDTEQEASGSDRSSNYLNFEARLLEIATINASRLHTGRSRQGIGSTLRRMVLREALLDTYGALLEARLALVDFAGQHIDTMIPAYTHGVQAQPTSLAHYLLAYSAAFERDADRLQEVYTRMNSSPLGSAALGTSGFSIDRERLAELLGFDSVIENSYDANLVSSADSKIEFVNALATSAIPVGQLTENLATQYHNSVPWIILAESQTGVSSIMPQKRNPLPLASLRTRATEVIGSAHTVMLNAHNTNSGMNDYRPGGPALDAAAKAQRMYATFVSVFTHLVVNRERALEEIENDYSTMTEVADTLLRYADVPFRTGYYYASALTTYGRAHGKRPKDLTDEELRSIYKEVNHSDLPIDVALIKEAMDPAAMVRNRKGLGGPQPAEVERMLLGHLKSLEEEAEWLRSSRQRLATAGATLEKEFETLQ